MKLPRRQRKARVEMLPLMDIVFLLLVFFIYSMMSMAIHRVLQVNLPQSSSAEIDRTVTLALMVSDDGSIYLDKQPVRLDDLATLLKEKNAGANEAAERSLQIFADGSLSYQELYRVLDQVKLSGMKRISLQAALEVEL